LENFSVFVWVVSGLESYAVKQKKSGGNTKIGAH
jgi:hypothetical protein